MRGGEKGAGRGNGIHGPSKQKNKMIFEGRRGEGGEWKKGGGGGSEGGEGGDLSAACDAEE